jgi:hypothetical protein
VARDLSDRGAIASLNQYGYRRLRQRLGELEAEAGTLRPEGADRVQTER